MGFLGGFLAFFFIPFVSREGEKQNKKINSTNHFTMETDFTTELNVSTFMR
jgi:hypothetical protein